MPVSNIQNETFQKLLAQIRQQVIYLKGKNRDLQRENEQLRAKLTELKDNQSDIFSSISEAERIAMKHQVDELIRKIDKHMN
ncbi:MAG: hypothetical protein EA360_05300 [Balneolaceae bacterium]|nr:MAG: hypothetical protein EA360_05300 [Balneolaceae bacterium]